MDVSIIILNWNTRELTLECLRSIVAQKGIHTQEIILVDNGSTDGSQEAVRAAFPDVRVIENGTNYGFAKGNNIGILNSKGRYICLVNSDARLLENCLDQLIVFMDANPNIGLAGPKILYPDLTIQDSCRKFPSLWNNLSPALGLDKLFKNVAFFSGQHLSYFKHDTVRLVDYVAGCVMMVRRKAIDEVGLLDERFFIYHEEVDWCKRLNSSAWKVIFYPEAAAVHHHAASASKDPIRFTFEFQKSSLQYWEKHYTFMHVLAIRSVFILHHIFRLIARSAVYCLYVTRRPQTGRMISHHIACLSILFRRKDQL
jgi:GT2 family glycosyltransferase